MCACARVCVHACVCVFVLLRLIGIDMIIFFKAFRIRIGKMKMKFSSTTKVSYDSFLYSVCQIVFVFVRNNSVGMWDWNCIAR